MSRRDLATRERKMIDDYHDYRSREAVEPLCLDMQKWKAGQLSHAELDRAIHETHKKMQQLWSLFNESRDFLVNLVKMDEDWFTAWLKDNPQPSPHQ